MTAPGGGVGVADISAIAFREDARRTDGGECGHPRDEAAAGGYKYSIPGEIGSQINSTPPQGTHINDGAFKNV